MKNLIRILSSSRLALLLLLAFATAMAVATFVENDYGTRVAWQLIYDSWWFELIMLGLGLCFLLNISRYKLTQRSKWPVLLFHVAFIVILLGAAITRYTSSTGIMRIREGASSNLLISDELVLKMKTYSGPDSLEFQKQVDLTDTDEDFSWNQELSGQEIKVQLKEYLMDAEQQVLPNEEGTAILELVVADGAGSRTKRFLVPGDHLQIGQSSIGFETDQEVEIHFQRNSDGLTILSSENLDAFAMATQAASTVLRDSLTPLNYRTLYRSRDLSMVPLALYEKGFVQWVESSDGMLENDEFRDDVLSFDVQFGDQTTALSLIYREGQVPPSETIQIGDHKLEFSYGSDLIELPFSIQLNDFQLERYPGSESPSAYASEVEILEDGVSTPYRIFMNNVLDHQGYRFYQASYDSDEKGTVLAVNKDRPGTIITYLGYLLMGIGMCWTLFGRGTRFRLINRKLRELRQTATVVFFLLLSSLAFGQMQTDQAARSAQITIVPITLAEDFGRLLVQDLDGRIKPVNTLASELIRKLSRKPYYKQGDLRMSADQAFLSMCMDPDLWRNTPVIKVDLKMGGTLFEALNPTEEGLVSLQSLFGTRGDYLLNRAVEAANLKKPSERNEFDQEVLQVDERFNILFNMLSGHYLRIFPNSLDSNHTWYAPTHHFNDFPEDDAQFARNILGVYFERLKSEQWEETGESLEYIKTFQKVIGKEVIPSEDKIEAELIYNRLNLNFWLFQVLFTLGLLLLILAIVKVFHDGKWLGPAYKLGVLLCFVACLIFGANIGLRWFAGGHAPWSNGYEMLVFVSWVLFLCGFLSWRQSDFTLPLATLFSGALLFVSYLDWINPEITNLMPVLRSYWLKVHVATIVSSYAPLALSAVLGMMALILLIIRKPGNRHRVDPKIKELSLINEISMTIGLFVLAIGTFLGGVWANESWGRYWAWDPKETWALISIIVYAIILHLRLVPGLAKPLILNAASMFGFWAIIMTSFGVNYYLSGLHSYASGDPLPVPDFVYILAVLQIALWAMAYYRDGTGRKGKQVPAS